MSTYDLVNGDPADQVPAHHVALPKRFFPPNAGLWERVRMEFSWPDALRFQGSILPRILLPTVCFTTWATAITAIHIWVYNFENTGTNVLVAISLVVGLVLAFYTNAAYQRFRAGRQAVCELVITLRSLRQLFVTVYHSRHETKDRRDALKLLAALFVAVKRRLRREHERDRLDDYHGIIAKMEVSDTSDDGFDPRLLPLAIMDQIAFHITDSKAFQGTPALTLCSRLNASFTNLEKILGTPIPSAYTIHLKQVIGLYMLLFPIQVVETSGTWAIPATFMATFTLYGVEAIGSEIEDPFGYDWNDLPLDLYVNQFIQEVEASCTELKSADSVQDQLERAGKPNTLKKSHSKGGELGKVKGKGPLEGVPNGGGPNGPVDTIPYSGRGEDTLTYLA